VLGTFFLAPLIGECLLGNLPITWLWLLPILALLYGGGALLVRETTRRLQLGWPSMIVLGLAYAVKEHHAKDVSVDKRVSMSISSSRRPCRRR
jgi:hypothetical protein